MHEIIAGDTLESGLGSLRAVAERIFGTHLRQPGWFTRKLAREGVRPSLCAVALAPESREPIGYVLLGLADSRGPVARGASMGLIEEARGRGLGRRLLEFASRQAQAHGCEAVEYLAEQHKLEWYLDAGFEVDHIELSLAAPGLGQNLDLAAVVSPDSTMRGEPAWSWFPEAWSRTPPGQRLVLELDAGRIWLTREGHAWLALRAELRPGGQLDHLLATLRQRLHASSQLILYPVLESSPAAASASARGFHCIQRSFVVRRPTPARAGPRPAR